MVLRDFEPSQIVAVARQRKGQIRRSMVLPFPPMTACQTLVTKDGMSNKAIAVVKSKTAANNPKLTVGRPRPMTPFMPPASKKVPPIIIRVNVSIT